MNVIQINDKCYNIDKIVRFGIKLVIENVDYKVRFSISTENYSDAIFINIKEDNYRIIKLRYEDFKKLFFSYFLKSVNNNNNVMYDSETLVTDFIYNFVYNRIKE